MPTDILKQPDWSTDSEQKMQECEVTSLNVHPENGGPAHTQTRLAKF